MSVFSTRLNKAALLHLELDWLRPHSMAASVFYAFVTGVGFALSALEPALYALTWVSWVPVLLAVSPQARLSQAYLLGSISGFSCFALSCYWLPQFILNLKDYGSAIALLLSVLYWFYCGQLFALVLVLFTWLRRGPVPDLFSFPLIVSVCWALFPTIFSMQLGELQSQFLAAIQATSITGIAGLNVVIAAVNVAIAQLLGAGGRQPKVAWLALGATVCLWFGYGIFALGDESRLDTGGTPLLLGLVQSNEAPSHGIPEPAPGFSRTHPPEIALSKRLAAKGVDFIVWPETRYKGYFRYPFVSQAFAEEVNDFATPLMFQDMDIQHDEDGEPVEYNTAVLLNSNGEQLGTYRKVKRVAFGEYLPFFSDVELLRKAVDWVFGDFFTDISAGDGPRRFDIGNASIIPLICYEVLHPTYVARASTTETHAGTADSTAASRVLVNISNDSWFESRHLPRQHLAVSVLRAVENRLPLVHVINNGPSAVISAHGDMLFVGEAETQAAYRVKLPLHSDKGPSFFSEHPYWFLFFMYGCLLVAMGLRLIAGWRKARWWRKAR